MRHFITLPMILIISTGSADADKLVRQPAPIPNEYIVVVNDTPAGGLAIATSIDRLVARHGATTRHRFSSVLRGFSARLTEAQVREVAADPDVAYVVENAQITGDAIRPNATWGLDRIDQVSLPVDNRYVELGSGEGVIVYVIDSGIRTTHGEFAGRLLPGGFAVQDGRGVEDCNGHGTHVAGTIAGTTYGVAPRAKLVPIRVLDCAGSGAVDNLIAGLDFIASQAAPGSVTNMSIRAPANPAVDTAIRNLVGKGVTVVVSAGNDDADACLQSPAREPLAITVAASTESDARAGFSNFGACVDLFAPGNTIVSAGIASDSATATLNGTSMASPHVAGVVAAYLSANPGTSPAAVAAALIAGSVPDKITNVKGSPNRLLNTRFLDAQAPLGAIVSPANGARVPASFVVEADITEDNLERVELAVDGVLVESLSAAPFRFQVTGLADGVHTLELRSFDLVGQMSVAMISVTVGDEPEEEESGDQPPGAELGGGCSAGGAPSLLLALLGLLARRRRGV